MGSDLIREARRRAGLTQRQLAELAGTTQSAIARLESGRTSPSFDTVRRMMRLCGFNLLVALDPYDDSDLAQALAILRESPEQRLAHLTTVVHRMSELRKDAERQLSHA